MLSGREVNKLLESFKCVRVDKDGLMNILDLKKAEGEVHVGYYCAAKLTG